MKKLYLRLLIGLGINDRRKAFKILFIAFFCCCASYTGYGNVSITAATGGTSICNNKAVGGSAAGYTLLSPIIINEGNVTDFSGPGTDVIVLTAPAGWQFNTLAMPTFGYLGSADISGVSGSITSSSLTINITTTNNAAGDQVTITGLQVQATSASSAAGYIYASSVTGVAGITIGTAGSNFGNLSLTTLATPSVTISASPGNSICAGTNTVFSPTPSAGGSAPTYQWYLNGSPTTTGPAYSSSSLATGNYVTCIMTSNSSCVITPTATSNVVTMSVTPAPATIAGNANACPGTSTGLSDASSGGVWSSANTLIATINTSGVATGVAAGSVLISYTVGTCATSTTLTVNSTPIVPVITPSVTSICSGTSVTMIASGSATPPTIVSQTFNSGVTPWTIDNTGTSGASPYSAWKVCGDGYINGLGHYHSPDNSAFAMSNPDTSLSSSSVSSSRLISPVFSLVGYASATLTFQHSYEAYTGDMNVEVDISTNGGATWTPLQSYLGTNIGTFTGFVTQTIPLSAYLGTPNLAISFYYKSNWGYYWVLDNILLTGTSLGVVPTWSPTTYLFSDAALTTPYVAGTPANTVYMYPTGVATTTPIVYTATAANLGCSTTGTGTVTVNPSPTAITGSSTACVGLPSYLSDAVAGGTWSSSNTSVATITSSTGMLTGVAAGTTTITYTLPGTCYTTTTITVYSLPTSISGTTNVCVGSTTQLSDGIAGGTWSSNTLSVATVAASSGLVYGVSTGSSAITYTLGPGCVATTTVTGYPVPSGISGPASVCAGSSISLTDATAGGTWTSVNTAVATVGSATGLVTGVAGGTAGISYTLNTGCAAVWPVTINPSPSSISGVSTLCIGLSTILSDAGGGTWSSSNTSVATMGSTSGIVYAGTAGTSIVTYTLGTGCFTTTTVTVNSLPSAISGNPNVCIGLSTTLSDMVGGGTWSSSNTAYASVGLYSGVVTGIIASVVNITYTLGTSCTATTTLQVNPLSPITGTNNVCIGFSTLLSDATPGGTWSSSNTSLATVAAGAVYGISAGTTVISYALPTGCIATSSVVVNPVPSAIAGNPNVCLSSTTQLSDDPGGTWSSTAPSVATVGLTTGIVYGMNLGSTTITYLLSAGCMATTTVTVNPLPSSISGASAVCAGSFISLTDVTTGGSWSSSNTSFATVNATGGVTGVAAGTAVITYTLPTGCTATKNITVNPLPSAISGTTNVCVGLSTQLSDNTFGGTWSCSNTSVATILAGTGLLTGAAAGTANVTYGIGTGCVITIPVTVNPLPNPISGTASLCIGLTTNLSDNTTGGTWSSSNTAIATILPSGSGVVNSVSAGTIVITYTLGTGCVATRSVTVNSLPGSVSGNMVICAGSGTILSDAGGGTWSSGASGVATIAALTGVVTGVSAGTAPITFTLATGCIATASVLVNPLPAAISGTVAVCNGFTISLSDATSGGTWSSSNTSVATINDSGPGIVTSVAPGTTTIAYTLATGCASTRTVTVNPLPGTITGSTVICAGLTTALSDAGGGTWSSSNTSVATVVAASGVVTGVASGTTIITYTLPTGCIATTSLTVNSLPASIIGSNSICYGSAETLSDATSGGTWISSNLLVASIDPVSGYLTTTATGSVTITYFLGTGCVTTTTVTVNPLPGGITGQISVCVLSSTTLSDVTPGGTWSSSNTALATVGISSGTVGGVSAGTVSITFTSIITGCMVTRSMTVNPIPPPITGASGICLGAFTTLSDAAGAGTWSSNNTTVANINSSTGLVFGTSTGTAVITYTVDTGCSSTATLTVNPLPSAISGANAVCVGAGLTLSDAGGGTWSSGNTSIATVGLTTGVVTGVGAGTVSITYTLPTGCTALKNITVNAAPSAISGATGLCLGSTTLLSDEVAGGTWSSLNTTVANIDPASGLVTGVSSGSAVIVYTLPGSCTAIAVVTVNALPGGISGSSAVCVGLTTPLSDISSGGSWTSSNTAIATVSSSGVVTGVTPGPAVISYTLSTGCSAGKNVTVYASPGTISGSTSICYGAPGILSDAVSGGTWSSSNTVVAMINPSSGLITTVTTGATIITYSLPGGCSATTPLLVNPAPSAILGTANTCVGLTTSLSDIASGGTWSSSNTSVATVNLTTGLVKGQTAGTAVITYALSGGCMATTSVTVNSVPTAITGNTNICLGSVSALSDAVSGGTWSSSNNSVASIGSASGTVTGLLPGTATISYSVAAGCAATAIVNVNSLPGGITGISSVCTGSTGTLSDATSGGTWSSSNTSVATVNSSGVVTGVAPGSAVISYSLLSGCSASRTIVVYQSPSAIIGAANICLGATTSLSNSVAGGTWSSSVTTVATIDPLSGAVTTVAAGSTTISYTAAGGCSTSLVFTVNPSPGAISGNTVTCVGLTTALSDVAGGGTWSSSNTTVATVNLTTGLVKGLSAGNAVITYSLVGGCTTTTSVTVDAVPTAIIGSNNMCAGSSVTLSDATSGGTWSSSNTIVANIGPASGTVSSVSPGTTTIAYSVLPGCAASITFTVNPVPGGIIGVPSVCIGLTTHLSDLTTGGTWSSNNTSVATVSGSGLITGGIAGTAVISYTLGTGCSATRLVTVNALPTGITGITNVCLGSTSVLSNGTAGGTWSSSNTAVATVDVTGGVVYGVALGSANITYSLGASCASTTSVSVIAAPAAVTGTTNICIGQTTYLSDGTSGGSWTSSNTAVATVLPANGFVTSISPGTSFIAYAIGTGCVSGASVVVNPLPSVIYGSSAVCVGNTISLSNTTSGGTWSSGTTSVATVGVTTGIISGVSAGTSVITYAVAAACTATTSVTVNALPAAVTGAASVCIGVTTQFSDASASGTWSSDNTSIASVDATGLVSGITAGTANIIYTLPSGCTSSRSITVTTPPSVISGYTTICLGGATTLSDMAAGGTWSSSNTTIAAVGASSGIVSGMSVGTANITYTLSGGCFATSSVSVISLPPAIQGSTAVCVGSSTTLSDNSPGGAWSSSNTSVATISTTGVVSAVSAGNTVISYLALTGCTITTTITVNPLPSAIAGASAVCVGSSTTLSDAGGGTWSVSNTAYASIVTTTGTLTGLSAGPETVIYTLATGCMATKSITVMPLPQSISGAANICSGNSEILSDADAGGTWTSSSSSVASVNAASGLLTGGTAGTAAITYTLGTGCAISTSVIVNPLPVSISGNKIICVNATTALSDAGIGTWSSNNTSVATVTAASGVVTGVSAGNTLITYTLGTGCLAVTTVTVNPLPVSISGATAVCAGSAGLLSDASVGGTWTSATTSVATIGTSSGIVSGIAAGTSVITYQLITGCLTTSTITVNPLPSAISGAGAVCVGSLLTLSDAAAGGTWSSGNSSIATVGSSSGQVGGVAAGVAPVTYTLGTGCTITASVTVNPLSLSITGVTGVCASSTTVLSDATAGGTWSSGNTSIASITSAGGVVHGISSGTSPITYTLGTGCAVTNTVTVFALPSAIGGTAAVCVNATTQLSDAGGGSWSSGATGLATVGISSGIVSGIAAGNVPVTYTLGTGCVAITTVTVNPLPAAISGPASVCAGSAITLSDAGGGTWLSVSTAVATVGVTSGVVSGVSPGTSAITYTLPTGCTATTTITVNTIPGPISGAASVCAVSSTVLSDGVTGGTWSSSNTGIALVGLSSGVVSGVAAGSVNITYSLTGNCSTVAPITVLTTPSSITGSHHVCLGGTSVLSDTPSGGTWSSNNTSVAAVNSSGTVSGVSPGVTTISYSLGTGCTVTASETVDPVLPITGSVIVCAGDSVLLSDGVAGGSWSSASTFIATVNAVSGMVTGVSGGTVGIVYTSPAGCTTSTVITVNPLAPIGGTAYVCKGATSVLYDAVTGGVWTSSNTTIATISSSGVVSGVDTGTVTIIYTLSSGCTASLLFRVDPVPVAITGNPNVCIGTTTYLSDATPGGTWGNSSATGVVTIGVTAGAITGLAVGSEAITYTSAGGCTAVTTVTVNPTPGTIIGSSALCQGSTAAYSDPAFGGAWSSGNTAVATIVSSSGVLTGVTPGVTLVTYTSAAGCITAVAVSVDPLPPPITGAADICAGGATEMVSDSVAGGIWNSTMVTVSPTGLVTSFTSGTAVITYTLPTGCFTTAMLYVNPLPNAISGSMNICVGSSTALTDISAGGVWSTANTGIATVTPAGGTVYGISAGTATITYTMGTGCYVTALVTVHPPPAAITGASPVCAMSSVMLSDATAGGTWASGTPSVATVGITTGLVTGLSGGTATITYTLGTGCYITATLTVNSLPPAITGVNHVCIGSATTLSESVAGAWSSANTSVAAINAASGVVSGVSVNTTTITYTAAATGCSITTPFSVYVLPPAIAGITTLCPGSSVSLSDAMSGGTWSSGAAAIATVGITSGMLSGVAAGATYVTYTMPTGCLVSTSVTIYPVPAVYAVTGGGPYCSLDTGVHVGLSGSGSGIVYTLYRGSATVSTTTGTSAALDFGLQTLAGTYTVQAANNITGCSVNMSGSALVSITAAATPSVSISGGTTVCAGLIATFTALPYAGGSSPAYQWKVNGVPVSTLNTYYYVPVNGDIVSVFVTSNASCLLTHTATATTTVSTLPYETPAVSISVAPAASVCAGTSVTFTPAATHGGLSPVYKWVKNGAYVYTGTPYAYMPLNNDSVYCTMVSNYTCLLADSAASNSIIMSVTTVTVPSVSITVLPGTTINAGQPDTLIALVSGAGTSPACQWYVNGVLVPGVTGPAYINANFANGDSVSCVVTANGICGTQSASAYVIISVSDLGVAQVSPGASIRLVPNPNKGDFTLKGTLGNTAYNDDVSVDITDMLGQVVYREKLTAKNGSIDQHINLGTTLANGMYLLTLHTSAQNILFHFVIEQ